MHDMPERMNDVPDDANNLPEGMHDEQVSYSQIDWSGSKQMYARILRVRRNKLVFSTWHASR